MPDLKLGKLTLVGTVAGSHVRVAVLGDGMPGHRPLCGTIVLRDAEWVSLVSLVNVFDRMEQSIQDMARKRDAAVANAEAQLVALATPIEVQRG